MTQLQVLNRDSPVCTKCRWHDIRQMPSRYGYHDVWVDTCTHPMLAGRNLVNGDVQVLQRCTDMRQESEDGSTRCEPIGVFWEAEPRGERVRRWMRRHPTLWVLLGTPILLGLLVLILRAGQTAQ